MDNITHTVIGLVTGDGIHHATNRHEMQSVERRRLFLLASAMGNNIPDLDIFFKMFYAAPVGNLLHHRGYTHTLLTILPQAVLILAFLFTLRGGLISKHFTKRDWIIAGFAAALGVATHIFADGWNSYGIHPFYPFDNSWHFGDTIFIIEPMIWAICGAWIVIELPFAWRAVYFSTFSLVFGFGFSIDAISFTQVLFLIGLVSGVTLLMGLVSSSKRASIGVLLLALLLGTFNYYSKRAHEYVKRAYGNDKVEDIALSPMPTNPFCWNALAASVENGEFVIRRANVSLWPERLPAVACRFSEKEIKPVTRFVSDASVDWTREYRTPLGLFTSYQSDCYFKDWMRFSRMPYIHNGLARDVRFANRGSRNFTDLILKPGRECVSDAPPWIPPRANLLTEVR